MKQRQCGVEVDASRPAGRPVERQRNVVVEADQVAAEQRLIAEFQQVLLPFCALHFAGVVEHGLQRAVLFEQLPGELRPDQRHAGHVVHRIADQGLEIDHLSRRDSPVGEQLRLVVDFILADVVDLHPLGDQLAAVLVAGHQEALPAELVGPASDGGQHVVGLVGFAVQRGNAQGGDHPANGRKLRGQVVGHFGPLHLILLVHLVPEGLARQIERAKQIVRPLLFQQVEQIAGEAEDGPHRLAPRTGHLRQGVKDLMDQRMGVDHPDRSPSQRFGW